ncbi:hypothetical protein NMY22_g18005 [Coprinellus aureogranulatus]|nr:hypothetical protein NMY22_g18005 [Coprinellus aureogranulatus]
MLGSGLKNDTLAYALAVIALYGFYRWKQGVKTRRGLPLPPGPKGLPLVGNLYDVPATFPWEHYVQWGKEYNSDLIYLNVAGNSIVVVNSHKAAMDLFEKRSSIYSSR